MTIPPPDTIVHTRTERIAWQQQQQHQDTCPDFAARVSLLSSAKKPRATRDFLGTVPLPAPRKHAHAKHTHTSPRPASKTGKSDRELMQ